MPQSFVQNFAHLVFSTKHRLPLITSDVETSLHKYLAATCLNLPDIGSVVNYIDLQHDHHGKETFQDKVRRFLFVHDIPFDERYMWD